MGYFSWAVICYLRRSSDSYGGEDAPEMRMQERPEEVRAACRLMEQRGQYHPPGGRLAVYTISKAKARHSGQSNISHHPRRIYIPRRPPSSVHPRTVARGTSCKANSAGGRHAGWGWRGVYFRDISPAYTPARPARRGGLVRLLPRRTAALSGWWSGLLWCTNITLLISNVWPFDVFVQCAS